MRWTDMDSPLGRLTLLASERGLHRLEWNQHRARSLRADYSPANFLSPTPAEKHLSRSRSWLDRYFLGEKPGKLPPLDLSGQADFSRRVLLALCKVPSGKVVSYGQLAVKVGSPGAARAVGNVMAANPIPILIPCHRVLAAGERLGGFSGGLDRKRKLLRLESYPVPIQ
ncbi:MAG: methylated-DNA--[protein]-cysteine S-methyltransferase [Candidatus Krumholzibacteria bacterium]|jgi:methylated-DNA-[protein]-cysteine S-methyltransferase|nr:methylated-DNA--[protein]-cysteine S-methyltransferase [Candidatus Krumholzibacteria bacterium]MDP6669117.1 methylated-DNA--[protein]-cysteine S-methyltransferase [Candidatus Krumholzibacteria bacterium]MDP6796488.1 methylated-DNA--[protein]-cysteine S-methyltransferase [Candidatus Krumholzibacteria bacterium]MDP7021986.1 methylated-DNA--[protein]-cysteine S-methyltransferase [Candidatus Krumholzibacteria bacterium]